MVAPPAQTDPDLYFHVAAHVIPAGDGAPMAMVPRFLGTKDEP
ncbi:MAG: hypothetical protein NVS2B16_32790 [Chloroflexota bacterium]